LLKKSSMAKLRHFELNPSTPDDKAPKTPGLKEGWEGILPSLGEARLFLDTYEEKMIQERLDHYGITEGVKAIGINKIRVQMNTTDSDFQHLLLYSEDPPLTVPFAEITLHKGMFATKAPFAEKLHDKTIPMLFVHWLKLQNPFTEEFQAGKPKMPGQSRPGLGISKKVMEMLIVLSEKLGTEGLANTPEYPHNAIFYSSRFLYLNPESEGMLRALKRDLVGLSLADFSWGIILGCVIDSKTGKLFEWFKEEQILPLGGTLSSYFRSRSYSVDVSVSESAHKYEIDIEKLKTLPREIPGDLLDPGNIVIR